MSDHSETQATQLQAWFEETDTRTELFRALQEERFLYDPTDPDDLQTLRDDRCRIAVEMDSDDRNPPMLWSGIPLPPGLEEVSCGFHLVVSVGGTKTEFALLRLEAGKLIGFDLALGKEVSSETEIERVKNASRVATPVYSTSCRTGHNMIRQIVAHMSGHLRPHFGGPLKNCEGILLSWGYGHSVVRTGADLVGGLTGLSIGMSKGQMAFTDLKGVDIGAQFVDAFEEKLGWSPLVAIANDTVMALSYFLGPKWRCDHNAVGLLINGTGSNFALAEPYAVRPEGYVSAPGESYKPTRLRRGRSLRAGETVVSFFVNYESGFVRLDATRTRFDVSDELSIERNALAGGNAFSQQLRETSQALIAPDLYERIRAGWKQARGDESAEPGALAVSLLAACDGSTGAVAKIFGNETIKAGEAVGLRLLARTIVYRSALHAALILDAVTERNGFGRGGTDGKPDFVGMEGSVWKIAHYSNLVKDWWQTIRGDEILNVRFGAEPSFNASLPGPLYLAALHR